MSKVIDYSIHAINNKNFSSQNGIPSSISNLWNLHLSFTTEQRVITVMAYGLRLRLTQRQIAELLNSKGLLTSHGNHFTKAIVRTELHKIRHPGLYSSKLRKTLLKMIKMDFISAEHAVEFLAPLQRGNRRQ